MQTVLALVQVSDGWVTSRLQLRLMPPWFDHWLRTATQLGNGWLWLAAFAALACFGGRYLALLTAIAVTAALSNASIIVLKKHVRRQRPTQEGLSAPLGLQASAAFAFDEFSFPSGHTLNMFALATLLTAAFPLLAPALAVLALSVAVSRVALGFHYLSDVLVGALLGSCMGAGVYALVVA